MWAWVIAGLAANSSFATLGEWLTHHPEYADWGVAAGTFALAVATVVLALQARGEARQVARQAETSAAQVEISRTSLEAEIRPILIDVPVGSAGGLEELVPYERAWARNVQRDEVHVLHTDAGNFVCSLPLRNAGPGVAFIKDNPRLTHPARDGDLIGLLTAQVVPPGEQTRAYFGPGIQLDIPADESLIAKVFYADASGSRTFWTEAVLQTRNGVWRVARVSIGAEGEAEPLVVSAAAV